MIVSCCVSCQKADQSAHQRNSAEVSLGLVDVLDHEVAGLLGCQMPSVGLATSAECLQLLCLFGHDQGILGNHMKLKLPCITTTLAMCILTRLP